MAVWIAGAQGMVGQALQRAYRAMGVEDLLTPSRAELDCLDQAAVCDFIATQRPTCIIIAAAKVGGILANSTFPAEFLYENMMIAGNIIHQAHRYDVPKLLFLGSTCIYPKFAPQPIKENALLTSSLEPTNEAYALAKIVGVKLCEFYQKQYGRHYFSVMPTNLYGLNDNYHPEYSHVIPAMIRRFHEAKQHQLERVAIWGSGTPLREFLFVDDLARACLFLLGLESVPSLINVGSNDEYCIQELARLIADTIGFEGEITNDLSKPDGTPRKKTDLTLIHQLGWSAQTSLQEGLSMTYEDFLQKGLLHA